MAGCPRAQARTTARYEGVNACHRHSSVGHYTSEGAGPKVPGWVTADQGIPDLTLHHMPQVLMDKKVPKSFASLKPWVSTLLTRNLLFLPRRWIRTSRPHRCLAGCPRWPCSQHHCKCFTLGRVLSSRTERSWGEGGVVPRKCGWGLCPGVCRMNGFQ